jgi:hypothetical protein
MPKGAGFCSAGTSPAGFGLPDVAAVNVPSPLPDGLTGAPLTGRFINYTVGDYVFSSDGRINGMSTVQQLVLLALLDGNILSGLDRKLPNYQRTIANRVQTALNPIILKGWCQLIAVTITDPSNNPDATAAYVKWKDLTLPAPGSQPGGTATQNIFSSPISSIP